MLTRVEEILEDILCLHSPSKREEKVTEYIIGFLENIGAEVYLDHNQKAYGGDSPTIFARIKGDESKEGITLNAHTDVVPPNEGLKIIKEESIWRTDGTTTLGGDDKAGVATMLFLAEHYAKKDEKHPDLYFIFTAGEEQGMLGARNIQWNEVRKHMEPAKRMVILDSGGDAGKVAYQAPGCYLYDVTVRGKKAHAGIEPEKGSNAIVKAAKVLAELPFGRIDHETTSNTSMMTSDFPSNVVPDVCRFTGEVRSHNMEKLDNYLKELDSLLEKYAEDYSLETELDYPPLVQKDGGALVDALISSYRAMGIEGKGEIIGGGSDGNFFSQEGFDVAVLSVGMEKVHTTEEYLRLDVMKQTMQALMHFIEN